MSKKRLLIISHDVVGYEMAGPGIRYYHLARVLSKTIETVLAIPQESPAGFEHPDFTAFYYSRADWHSIAEHYGAAGICLLPSDIAADFPMIGLDDTIIIIDGYNPLMAEWLAQSNQFSKEQSEIYWRDRMRQLSRQYHIGDFFICASERQRDWWLGLLETNGRLNPWNFRSDSSLRKLIDVVPYGLPEMSPTHTKAVIRGVWPNITEDDYLVLWGGGLWPWLDALTAIRAIAEIWETRQDIKLVFPGTRHPNPHVAQMSTQNQPATELAEQLGLLNRAVFFGDWIPYRDWTNVLLECNVALTLHHETLEARLAFRSRVLEYIWADLPIVATSGDATGELIAQYNLGYLVQEKDPKEVADAILKLVNNPLERFGNPMWTKARDVLAWNHVARPLVEFCKEPRKAPDRTDNANTYPYFIPEFEQLCQDNQDLVDMINRYKEGKFIRFMAWLNRVWKKKQ